MNARTQIDRLFEHHAAEGWVVVNGEDVEVYFEFSAERDGDGVIIDLDSVQHADTCVNIPIDLISEKDKDGLCEIAARSLADY